jgi:DNA-binding transcriptional MocR family regulator
VSSEASKWALRQAVSDGGLKNVLSTIGWCADNEGVAYPSQKTIAGKCGLSERSVRRLMAQLEALGLIQRHKRSRGSQGRTSDLIVLQMHKDFTVTKAQIQALRKGVSYSDSQPAILASATGHSDRGIGSDQKTPSQGENSGKIVGSNTRTQSLRVLRGGRE